ncbi:MAG: HD domain-containing phosphohydrolase [Candidatus Izemoplasmataceae bacterium]
MLANIDKRTRQITIFFIIFVATVVGYLYTTHSYMASTLWPAVGFSAAYFTIFKKQVIAPILLAIFTAGFLTRILFYEEVLFISLFLTVVSVISNLIVILIFEKTISLASQLEEITAENTLFWFAASVISPLFGALFSISIWYIVYPSDAFLQDFLTWSIGDAFGLLIFSSSIFLSYIYDPEKIKLKHALISAGYILFAGIISYLLFFVGEEPLFGQYAYIYFLIFFTATFFFTFRTIVLLSGVFVIAYSLFLIQNVDSHTFFDVIHQFNLYLFSLITISSVAKIVIHNLRANNKILQDTNKELDKLIDSTNSILQMSKVFINEESEKDEDLLYQMFQIAKSIFHNFDYGTCYLKRNDKIFFVDSVGYDTGYLNRLGFDPKTFVFNKDKIEVVNQEIFDQQIESEIPEDIDEYYKEFPRIKSSVRFGIFLSNSVIGGMSFDQSTNHPHGFTKYELDNFDSFQKLMNGFYEINYLNTKNDKLKNDLVLSLVRTLELYDHYTGGHSEDVAFLALEIAKRMQLSKQDQYDIYWAGIVHDIGKVGIDVSIINKQGKLSPIEFEEIKKHPIHGYNILSRSEDLKRIALWVKSHHEWWNGEGYPEGLAGTDIPIGGQILCVADAVSSMATIRSYSAQKSCQDIKDELILFKGIQFSPIVCNHMIEMIDEGIVSEYFDKD